MPSDRQASTAASTDLRAVAEEWLAHEGFYRYSDRRRSSDEVHAMAEAHLRLLAENEELRGRLKLACEPCAECGHIDWRELDDILETA